MKTEVLAAMAVASLAMGLTGCATMPNPIADADRAGMHVAAVNLAWEAEDADRPATQSFELEKRDIEAKIHEDVVQAFAEEPGGPTLVDFKVYVTRYTRVGAMMGNIVGGANSVTADVDVVRESDGRVVGTYNAIYGFYASNHGVIGAIAQSISKPDIPEIMAQSFAANLRERFATKASFAFKPTRRPEATSAAPAAPEAQPPKPAG